ncbi:MAG: MbcA/ParS/Xre antitoxin family protein [Actinomycetota bacterium]|nr:MbcA/ParS/Xre antitoxin family protein [Actinomycetota bacterium]
MSVYIYPEDCSPAVRRAVLELFSPDAARIWLNARHPMLDHTSPADVLAHGEGRVLNLLDALATGAYL